MRTVVVRTFGGPEVLEIVDLPEPDVSDTQVLVRVVAAPVTPVDLDIRSGDLAAAYLPVFDHYAMGRSAAGVVERVGAQVTEVTGLAVGDDVMVCADGSPPPTRHRPRRSSLTSVRSCARRGGPPRPRRPRCP